MEPWKLIGVIVVSAVVLTPIVVYTVGPYAARKLNEIIVRRKEVRGQAKKEREHVRSLERARRNGAEL